MARAIDSEVAFCFLTEQKVKETGVFSKGVNKGLNIARSAMRNPDAIPTLPQPSNEALTLEELREMDGEPVYSGKYKRWFLVIYFNALNKSQLMDRTGTPYITEDCAPLYRRPPEGEEEP